MSTKELPGKPPSENIPIGGYGIHFEIISDNGYEICTFADVDGDHTYDDGENEKLEEIRLEGPIYIGGLFPKDAFDQLDVVFVSPDPTIFANNDKEVSFPVVITLSEPIKHSSVNVNIYKSGLIEVE